MLHLHRAERADALLGALAEILAVPPADPFTPEIVSVPTRGMERWLSQGLSERLGAAPGAADGVCAGVHFPPPGQLLAAALADASGIDPESDPWLTERLTWPLLEVVDDRLGDPWLAPLATHLGGAMSEPDPVRRDRRLSVVRRLAALFGRYAAHRPEMLNRWSAGATPEGGAGSWQAPLWRALRERIAVPDPAERLAPACARLREDSRAGGLGPRLGVFGLTRLAAAEVQILRALAAHRAVHLFLLHPSAVLWRTVAASVSQRHSPALTRDDDPTADSATNPLLASWGRDSREMQLILTADEASVEDHHHPIPPRTGGSLLARIQDDVVADRAPPGPPADGVLDRRIAIADHDHSIQIHACHGRARQVEVLREAILHLLADDPTLEPRDVLVMCPDIEAFAPLIAASFSAGEQDGDGGELDGNGERADTPELRVRLADRSLRQTNPILSVAAVLLDLAQGRLTASEVLDLAARDPVRRRFRLSDEDLSRLAEWIEQTGVHWGIDAAHRGPYNLTAVPDGTWSAGLDRILLGVAMDEDGPRVFGDVLPLDDVEGDAIELAGRFAEFFTRLRRAVDDLARPQELGSWLTTLRSATESLATPSQRDRWQWSELERVLGDLAVQSTGHHDRELSTVEVRALLRDGLAGRPTRANFRTGHLTVCTLYPMRSVPHRVVCLLGLDDGAFPRQARRDGDDVTLERPQVGERDPRSEDRQLLLDALLSATDRVIVTYSGHDERTNVVLPPAVPVGELLDVIRATVQGDATSRVVVQHPLQPFDARNFRPGGIVAERRWGFDRTALRGAQAQNRPRTSPAPLLAEPLEPVRAEVIALEDLVRFVQHPVRAFVRERLGLIAPGREDRLTALRDALPVELDGLEQWTIGDRLLGALLAGGDPRAVWEGELRRGTLPPGELGKPALTKTYRLADAIRREAMTHAPADTEPSTLDVRVELGGGRLLTGTIDHVYGDLLLAVTYSKLAAKHRLSTWVQLLAATAAEPDSPFHATAVGRASARHRDVETFPVAALPGGPAARREAALTDLRALVALYDRGLCEPLPIAAATSAAYAQAVAAGDDPREPTRIAWEGKWVGGQLFRGEAEDPYHQLVFGQDARVQALLAEPPRPEEAGPGWAGEERSRFARLARRLWDPVLRGAGER